MGVFGGKMGHRRSENANTLTNCDKVCHFVGRCRLATWIGRGGG